MDPKRKLIGFDPETLQALDLLASDHARLARSLATAAERCRLDLRSGVLERSHGAPAAAE